jgi:hypothetical protein
MAQMEEQQVWTVHDGPPGQWGGHWVVLKHPMQWFVLQDGQGRRRRRGRRVRLAARERERERGSV